MEIIVLEEWGIVIFEVWKTSFGEFQEIIVCDKSGNVIFGKNPNTGSLENLDSRGFEKFENLLFGRVRKFDY